MKAAARRKQHLSWFLWVILLNSDLDVSVLHDQKSRGMEPPLSPMPLQSLYGPLIVKKEWLGQAEDGHFVHIFGRQELPLAPFGKPAKDAFWYSNQYGKTMVVI